MIPSISNISLPSQDHEEYLAALSDLGFKGLEVAWSKVWGSLHNITPARVNIYRRKVEAAGLRIIGMHSLYYGTSGMALFQDYTAEDRALHHLVYLSKICADLGGSFLILGSPSVRRRGQMTTADADSRFSTFLYKLSDLLEQTDASGTMRLGLEALPQTESDYLNTSKHALRLVEHLQTHRICLHLDAKSLVAAGEATADFLSKAAQQAIHFHVNQPGFGVLRHDDQVDHCKLGALLRENGYAQSVSIEQTITNPEDILGPIRKSREILAECYA
ncbi:MAG: sugar phosphate isomerase/epimerase [Proteobacteria bacterium]|nr:sugar phosphate isomerase/epimerase [Pseudomonadota bacterium]